MKKHPYRLFIALTVIFIAAAALGIGFGSTNMSFGDFVKVLFSQDSSAKEYRILYYVRIPRVIAAALSGAALAVSGVIIQGMLNNPLAGPNIIGVNSGAGLGALLAMSLFPATSYFVPLFAFIGATLASLTVFLIAFKANADKITIILAGLAVGSILSAGSDVIKTVSDDIAIDANGFLIGGFSGVSIARVLPAACFIAAGLAAAFILARAIDILVLGEEKAISLGLNIKLIRFILIICAAVLAGAAVSFSGLLGFVGLIVPHIMRRFIGNNHRILIPASILAGASFVILCDLLSRVVFSPYEIPVGIIMSLIGGPFFIFLIIKGRGERNGND